MITEQSLKQRCTPEIIKRMVELAEGFEIENGDLKLYGSRVCAEDLIMSTMSAFPLIIHRAVEGWNKLNNKSGHCFISINDSSVGLLTGLCDVLESYEFKNYQPTTTTHAECACLHCLIDIFEGEENGFNR